VFLEKDFN